MTAPKRVHRHAFRRRSAPPEWVARLTAALAAWPGVRRGAFFQWTGLFVGGRCFAALPRTTASNAVLVRVSPRLRSKLLASGHARPYVSGSTSEWVRLPIPPSGPTSAQVRVLRAGHRRARTVRA